MPREFSEGVALRTLYLIRSREEKEHGEMHACMRLHSDIRL